MITREAAHEGEQSRRLTGSAVARAMACPASAVIDHDSTEIGEPAIKGLSIHGFLCDAGTVGPAKALETADPAYRWICENLDLDRLPLDSTQWTPELAIAYNVRTGEARELCRGRGRPDYELDFDLDPDELPATLDVCGLGSDFVAIEDYKTGWRDLPEPAENWQLRMYALAAARLFGRDRARAGIIRVREDGSVWSPRRAWFEPWDLDQFAQDLKDLRARIATQNKLRADGLTLQTTPSDECHYCPGFAYCGSQVSLLRMAKRALLDEEIADRVAELEPADVADLLERLEPMIATANKVRRQIDKYAKRRPLKLSTGETYGPVTQPGNLKLDGDRVYDLIADRYGPAVAARAVIKTATQSRLKDVLSPLDDRPWAKVRGELLAELEAEGAATRKPKTTLKRYQEPAE